MKVVIHFDGGCKPTNPGNKYGSYSIVMDEVFEITSSRFDLGWGTNNEAEFEALIEALDALLDSAIKSNIPFKEIGVQLFTDSTIVRNWIQRVDQFKPEKCKNERRLAMGKLAKRCAILLSVYAYYSIEWNSRKVNLEKFGH